LSNNDIQTALNKPMKEMLSMFGMGRRNKRDMNTPLMMTMVGLGVGAAAYSMMRNRNNNGNNNMNLMESAQKAMNQMRE
jgi:hypothetical protein